MSLTLHSVTNASTPAAEGVWLRASASVSTLGFAVVDRTFNPDGTPSNEFRHIYLFGDVAIAKDEWIRLVTGPGKYRKAPADKDGHVVHYFYWGSGNCVWNDAGGDTAALIRYTTINTKPVPPVPKP
ncbi:hypothetical protein SAMN04488069_11533 [Hymenobacter psychrophilus]|uniref:Uncharacterized protein n=2 Tax=Hymenobacter psychrophilus TaxID=651662 RepID=A0A1H3N4T6_9BACT|nr:hypothetical protein SAMN04488069_11533 [Hymenobacter psychrophilus]